MLSNCPICQSKSVALKFCLTTENFIYACKSCKTEFIHPQLNEEKLKELYSKKYYDAWGVSGNTEEKVVRKMKMTTFNLYLDTIKKYKTGGKILDIGCATGYFLDAALQDGFEPYGVEISEYASRIAKEKFGSENIFTGTIEDVNFPNDSFDVIVMSDLLEHVRNPLITLKKIFNLLKKDGVVFITTPDTDSFSNKLMGKGWSHYKTEHFFYFNFNSFKHLAQECGFEIDFFSKTKKALNIEYLYNQFKIYKHPVLTPLVNMLHAIIPRNYREKNFIFATGEMTIVLKKKAIES